MTEQPADPITSMISHLTKPESNLLLIQTVSIFSLARLGFISLVSLKKSSMILTNLNMLLLTAETL